MKVIGLTGGIGSGKSTVAGFLAELGANTIDLDKLGHAALRPSEVRRKLVDEFGKGILGEGGKIDRARLGEIVFNNPDALTLLNKIVHPVIDAMLRERLDDYRRQGVSVVVLEAAAFLEVGRTGELDELWVTNAPEAVITERIENRPNYSRETVWSRMRSQLPSQEKIQQANVVIDTNCSLDELRAKVELEWQKLMARLPDETAN